MKLRGCKAIVAYGRFHDAGQFRQLLRRNDESALKLSLRMTPEACA